MKSTFKVFVISGVVFLLSLTGFGTLQAQPEVETYAQLLKALRELHTQTEKNIEQAIDELKVREAWEMGKLIDEHILLHKDRQGYGQKVVQRLAADLAMSKTEIYRRVRFARAYPIVPPAEQLTWSHFDELLNVNDSVTRDKIAHEAEDKKWSRQELRQQIKLQGLAREEDLEGDAKDFTEPKRGENFHVYSVISVPAGPDAGKRAVDLGFSNYKLFGENQKFSENSLVTLDGQSLKTFSGAESERYYYKAVVTEIIDGDTLHAWVDLGFGIFTEQKLRLRGIDAPEIESAEGKQAKQFLQKLVDKVQGNIEMRTVRSDKYDRYLADIWAGSTYVNKALVEKDLAAVVTE